MACGWVRRGVGWWSQGVVGMWWVGGVVRMWLGDGLVGMWRVEGVVACVGLEYLLTI